MKLIVNIESDMSSFWRNIRQVVKMTTFGAAVDEIFVKMTTFLFQWVDGAKTEGTRILVV